MVYDQLPVRLPTAQEAKELDLAAWIRPLTQRLTGVKAYLSNLFGFLKTLSVMTYELADDGAVTITHTKTGSSVLYRADGNVVTTAARHNFQRGRRLLLNCSEEFDARS